MRGISISKSLGNLGLESPSRIYDAVKSSISSFTKKTVDVHMASDEELEEAAYKYLNGPDGTPSWVDGPGLKYRWSIETHRHEIQEAVFRVMQQQQENALKTLHRKEGPCPGCRSHIPPSPTFSLTASPQPQAPDQPDIPQVTSDLEILPPDRSRASRPSFHNIIPTIDDLRDPDYSNQGHSRKRMRPSTTSVTQDNEHAGPSRPRAPNPDLQDAMSVRSDPRVTIDSPTQDNKQATPSRPRALTTRDLQDTISIGSPPRAKTETPTIHQIQSNNLSESSTMRASLSSGPTVMNLRGKKWIFSSVEEQARILTDVVAHQLEVMESLLVDMDGDKAQLRRRALQCERHLEDYLFERKVELSR